MGTMTNKNAATVTPLHIPLRTGVDRPARPRAAVSSPSEVDLALDSGIRAIRTALVSISWTRTSLRRVELLGGSTAGQTTVDSLLDRVEHLLATAEATLVARHAFGEEPDDD